LRPVCQRANPDEENYRLESRVRENRTHGSEGGDGESRFRPLSGSSSVQVQKTPGFRLPPE
jgi:hypothetical protein